jgi:ATP-dependent helicase/nuclease subunit B
VPSLANVPIEVVATTYGKPALRALQHAVIVAKGGHALAPVTVIVPANHVGVTARRALASGRLGAVSESGVGVAAVTFLTVYRLAELLGSARLAASGRRPVSTPVVAAALRGALAVDPGMFAPVAPHAATETALVAAFGELSDVSGAGLDELGRASRRARDVVGLCRRARAALSPAWYDEADLTESAIAAVDRADARRLERDLGHVVVYLPQDLLQRQARLVAAVAERRPTAVIAGFSGVAAADAGVMRSLRRLGCDPPPSSSPPAEERSASAGMGGDGLAVEPETSRILTASDADDEVRAAVRAVVDAARAGTPLERIAILYGTPEPYARIVHEQLAAAGIDRNGAAVRPLAASVVGRTLLDLLALPDHDFRRSDVIGLLTRAGGVGRRRGAGSAPTAEWHRVTREAGVVAGREQWSGLLDRLASEIDRRAESIDAVGTDPFDEAGNDRRRDAANRMRRRAERVRELRGLVVGLIDELALASSQAQPWAERSRWLRRLADRLLDHDHRDAWPADEQRAADKVDAALDRLGSLDAVDGPAPLDVFRRTLEIELGADLGRVGRFGEGVLVGPVSFAVGLDLDLVVVLGLAEGSLPAAVHDDSLLPDAERHRLRGELPLRRERVGRDHRHLLAALRAGERHLLCAPRGDLRANSERVPSRWLVAVAAALHGRRIPSDRLVDVAAPWIDHVPSFAHAVTHVAFPATEQEYRLRAGRRAPHDPVAEAGARVVRARRSRAFTRFDGNLAGVAVPSPLDEVVSSTRLESWAACPFAYFVRHLLGVDPIEVPEQQLTITAMARGALVHEILELFVGDVLARSPERQPSPDQPWSADDHRLMRRLAEQVCSDYEARGLTGRAVFWRSERSQILALADRFLLADDRRRLAERSRPVAAELRFGFDHDGGPVDAVSMRLPDGRVLRFRGAADRVDVTEAGTVHVIDYKTGKADEFSRLGPDNPDERGTKLQLPVYGLAARQLVGSPDAPVEATYWFVSDRGGFKQLGYAVDDGVLQRVAATLAVMVRGIERGTFPSHPDDSGKPWVVCPYCDPDGLGVADLRREWERKRDDPALAAYADLAEPREPVDGVATAGATP